jgi:hypothetical protein
MEPVRKAEPSGSRLVHVRREALFGLLVQIDACTLIWLDIIPPFGQQR